MDCSAKILLLGKTGVGKSSFINYFLGKEVAKTAKGKPVTMDYFIPYKIKDGRYPIEIYDTRGLETMKAYDQLDEIISGIKKRNNSDNIFNWFHTIFYCVSMSNSRFEDFEVNFIRTLQQELTQHIHIILTHCDYCKEDKIRNMRQRILHLLGEKNNIEIFEVVCVNKKKRNGEVVQPYGREAISERVFNLLLEDIAHKISFSYAKALNSALIDVADKTLSKVEHTIDRVVKFKTLIKLIQDGDKANDYMDAYIDKTSNELEKELEVVQEDTNQRFNQILQPLAQLYTSYRGIVTNSFLDNAELNFDDAMDWSCEDWIESIYLFDDNFFMQKALPGLFGSGYIDYDFSDEDNPIEIVKIIATGIGDIFGLKKNLKRLCKDFYNDFLRSIPQIPELQQEAYKRIINFIKY